MFENFNLIMKTQNNDRYSNMNEEKMKYQVIALQQATAKQALSSPIKKKKGIVGEGLSRLYMKARGLYQGKDMYT